MVSNVSSQSVVNQNYLQGVWGRTQEILQVTRNNIITPIGMGACVGTLDLFSGAAIGMGMRYVGLGGVGAVAERAAEYVDQILEDLFQAAVVAPVMEEVVFRGVVQGVLHAVTYIIIPDIDISFASGSIKLAALVSIVATAVLFGLVHYGNGIGLTQVVIATVTGVVYGVLRHNYGLLSSTTAHIVNNSIAVAIMAAAADSATGNCGS